ncbi:8302_t:CDS:2 [Scutellospora calospora]|uniref:8302_t:CDS:1 n=1 Tax=Scutellospora calospora TaxID=85575 RepID=A0ACA9JUY2_9GLOM|nr:8302_t:CDS:2 [Scutellospora calospora]
MSNGCKIWCKKMVMVNGYEILCDEMIIKPNDETIIEPEFDKKKSGNKNMTITEKSGYWHRDGQENKYRPWGGPGYGKA